MLLVFPVVDITYVCPGITANVYELILVSVSVYPFLEPSAVL